MDALEEPLALSAPMTWQLADKLCWRDPETGERCSWYHGLWQYLRMMELVETPPYHAAFFRQALESVPYPEVRPRVLVSGTADYSMLAHVIAAFRARGAEPDATVIDLCPTPLALSRWYAERAGLEVKNQQASILDYEDAGAFDVICTHAFLGRFAPADRVRLFARWGQLLRPGGQIITVTPVRPGHPAPMVTFTPDEVQAFGARVQAAAEGLRDRLPVDPAVLAEAARRYASHHRVFPVRSEDELRDLLERSGLRIVQLLRVPAVSGDRRAGHGPTVVGTAEYVRLVAARG